MICTCFGKGDQLLHPGRLSGLECAEIRLDQLKLDADAVRELFSLPLPTIATCRMGALPASKRLSLLIAAVESGAAFVDLDRSDVRTFIPALAPAMRRRDCRLIVSHHDHEHTPGFHRLRKIAISCLYAGANLVKIACRVNHPSDATRLMSLYNLRHPPPSSLLAIGMGPAGTWTRIAALALGAPLAYAAPDDGKETAPGQLKTSTMVELRRILISGGLE
ncbi:MAG TPA: type I 3-dehydroquinate dehydratase [Candidatus Aminicenantes bacterium]|nr:type I 3-dehydroquinate dehydratase [Candidatus Aminicenantes bacterium]